MDTRSGVTFSVNGVTADFRKETLRDQSGKPIDLRPQCFAVLRYLTENADRLVTKDELMQAVWPGTTVTDDSLVQCIHKIREALQDHRHAVLKTVRRRGYRLLIPEEIDGLAQDAAPPVPVKATTAKTVSRLALAAVAALMLAGGALAWRMFEGASPRTGDAPISVAVSRSDDLRSDPERRYLADGSTEDLLVDLELVLAVDVSASMDSGERRLQRQGFAAAFRSPKVLQGIRSGPHGRIAVAYVEWGDPSRQALVMPWRLVNDAASAESIARFLEQAPINRFFWTSMSGALRYAAELFDGNGFVGERRVIDVSGDGPNNIGPPVVPARDEVIRQGVTVNGLPIMIHIDSDEGRYSIDGLDIYYKDCVVGGPGAFVVALKDPDQFAATIERKLMQEIAGRPDSSGPIEQVEHPAHMDCLAGEKNARRLLQLK